MPIAGHPACAETPELNFINIRDHRSALEVTQCIDVNLVGSMTGVEEKNAGLHQTKFMPSQDAGATCSGDNHVGDGQCLIEAQYIPSCVSGLQSPTPIALHDNHRSAVGLC